MAFNEEQLKAIQKWDNANSKKRECPSCDNPSWKTIPGEFALTSNSEQTKLDLMPVVCQSCGFIKLYSLETILTQFQIL